MLRCCFAHNLQEYSEPPCVFIVSVTNKVVSSAYWAAGCGVGGFAGLQEQLHPEVHGVLLRSLHLGRLGKLTVQDERLHNRCHIPERNTLNSLISNK